MAVKSESMLVNRLSAAIAKRKESVVLEYAFVTAVTLLAAVQRFFKLDEWSFWIDEIATIHRALGHFNLETMLEQWWRPPLSIIFTGGILSLFGISEWSARLTSALIGVISIPIFYFLVKSLLNQWVAFSAAILLAISPWHIFWSQNARFYTSLMLLYFIASIAFFLFIEKGRVKYLILFTIFFFFAISERLIAILIVPVLFIYLLSLWIFPFEKPVGFKARYLAFLALPGIAYAILELYSFLTTSTTRLGFALNTFGGRIIDDPFRIFILIVYNIGIPLVCLALLSGFYLIKGKNRFGLFLFLSAVVPSLLVAAISLFTFIVDRYAFITLPSWIMLASYGVVEVYRRFRSKGFLFATGALLLLIADAGGANLMYYQINQGNRPEWRKAFEYVTDRAVDGDVIVSSVPVVGSYYTKQDVVWLGEINPQEIENSNNRYWFVLDSENSWFSSKNKFWVEEHADLLELYFLRVRENMHLRIYFYSGEYQNPVQ